MALPGVWDRPTPHVLGRPNSAHTLSLNTPGCSRSEEGHLCGELDFQNPKRLMGGKRCLWCFMSPLMRSAWWVTWNIINHCPKFLQAKIWSWLHMPSKFTANMKKVDFIVKRAGTLTIKYNSESICCEHLMYLSMWWTDNPGSVRGRDILCFRPDVCGEIRDLAPYGI